MKTHTKLHQLLAPLLSIVLILSACASTSGPGVAQTSERQAKAQAMFAERCKTAGEKIHRTVENVEGVYLLKLRPKGTNYGDQFKLDDPYGRDLDGEGYVKTFVRDSFAKMRSPNPRPEWPLRIGYSYVEVQDSRNGQRYRYTGAVKAVRKKDATALNVQMELRRNPNYDLNIYEFVLDRIPAPGAAPRYGVTYDDISTHEEREYWIAGSSLKVIDLQTNEVIAERIGYMMDWAQGSQVGGRSPWLFAADNACPDFHRFKNPVVQTKGASNQSWQTLDFVEKVLKPSK
ncbi:MAG: hypothetical protein PSV40_01635 [Polaromonas sp.]|uniref:hypothetical protein n=1 Tax=Polaromonas sp. TaxID=1869339 RepID=UPI002488FB26|nr:hypothetical protein [Polaromonas sp.]MDI1267792.1 hypothetical protein [Polaromonas sp.]